MPSQPKVFISYASSERELAIRLRADLEAAGADAWQFEQSAVPGTDAWASILTRISESDYFVVLLSPQAVQSRAVREEIDHAHYSSLNGPDHRPVAIPLILDDSVTVPPKLTRAVRMAYRPSAHATVVSGLTRAMGIEPSAPLFASAADLEMTRISSEEFDIEREVKAFFSSLVERNAFVADQYQVLVAPTQRAAGGRFQHGNRTVIEWFVADANWRFRNDGGKRREEFLFLVREPLVFGVSHGYVVETNVVAQVRAVLRATYVESKEEDFAITENRLTLRFEGFLDAIPTTFINGESTCVAAPFPISAPENNQ